VTVTPPGATDAISPWPGPATLVWGTGLVLAAALAADGLREHIAGASFSFDQPIAVVVTIVAVLTPLACAILWFPNAADELHKSSPSAVPAFVAADSLSTAAPRTLLLRADRAGRVLYSMLNGPGPVLGDADMAPPGEVWEPIDSEVAALASGRGGNEIQVLSGYGVRFVLLAKGTSTDLIPILDGEPGLRRLSSANGEVLWGIDGVTSRARLLTDGKASALNVVGGDPAQVAAVGVDTDPYLADSLEAAAADRQLVVGALANGGWKAVAIDPKTGDQTSLEAVTPTGTLAWSQAFTVPPGTTQVEVRFDAWTRTLWMWMQLIVLIVLVVLALPTRRIDESDPDLDGFGFDAEAVSHEHRTS
jgi:hypothetical protein